MRKVFLILVARFAPGRYLITVPDAKMEEGIKQKNDVFLDGDGIKQRSDRFLIDAVRHKGRLDHDERVVDIFSVEYVSVQTFSKCSSVAKLDLPVESSLIWRVVKYLQETTAT